MKNRFLAGLTPAQFMRRHWQKRALLARDALGEYAAELAVTREALFDLATHDNVESRIVAKRAGRWTVRHGPFSRRELARMPRRDWTLLVQGVDQSLSQASRLMSEFAFIPHARLDDVMVSYAAPGGGVGPHFDSYDVFLLQGHGRRRWQVSRQRDLELVADAPVKILARFAPDDEWTVDPGDLLYLPPQYAHDGVAIDECITYSIGFRAPAAQDLVTHFLDFLHDRVELEGRYTDAGLKPTRTPGRVPRELIDHASNVLDRLRWSRADVERFMGAYLTEPKANVVFERPQKPLSAGAFAQRAAARGVRLALPTRLLVSGRAAFVNGERHASPRGAMKHLTALADTRELPPKLDADADTLAMLYAWYLAGYIQIRPASNRSGSRRAAAP